MDVAGLLRGQDGVVARWQILAAGGDDNFIETQIRRREWARLHRGVYVDHTGAPTWDQRAWGAVLFYWPAALCSHSALRVATGRRHEEGDRGPVEVAVEHARRVRRVPGIKITRVRGLAKHVQPQRQPFRVRVEHALAQAASAATTDARALALLADACQRGVTTADRLSSTLEGMPRLPRRRFLLEVLRDVGGGAHSVLEHRYLVHVERRHALPTAARQRRVRQGRGPAYRDVEYLGCSTVVELDGRLGHEFSSDRWRDLERDVDSTLAGDVTLRLGWAQVLEPCRTAALVARLLQARGWRGSIRLCSACQTDRGAFPLSGAGNAPTSAAS